MIDINYLMMGDHLVDFKSKKEQHIVRVPTENQDVGAN
jgi:hypothetical protein